MPNDAFGHPQPTSRTDGAPEAAVASRRGFATRAIRTGQDPDSATGATIVPIYQTATFTQEAVGKHKGFDYSRSGNPTRSALERQLADLEGANFAVAYGSGMAAANGASFSFLRAGDHIVATKDLYGGTFRLFADVFTRYGIETSFVEMCDIEETRAAIRPNTKIIWVETPTNPLLKIIDIRAIAALKKPGQIVVADNTFATPYWQNPLEFGADVVMHSTTKYLGGHSDTVGGIVMTNDEELYRQFAYQQNAVGAVPGPWDAYLVVRGTKTLALRMREHERNAHAVARFLESRDDVAAVYYPGLASHEHHELAKRQMRGFGGIVSFRHRGGADAALAFVRSTQLFNLATSLGGVESLVCSPWTMTHGSVPPEHKTALGIGQDLVRLSVGIEDEADLLADLSRALDVARAEAPVFAIA